MSSTRRSGWRAIALLGILLLIAAPAAAYPPTSDLKKMDPNVTIIYEAANLSDANPMEIPVFYSGERMYPLNPDRMPYAIYEGANTNISDRELEMNSHRGVYAIYEGANTSDWDIPVSDITIAECSYGGRTASTTKKPEKPYILGFVGGSFTPTERLDSRIQDKLASAGEDDYTYCFVMISGRTTDAKRNALAEHGVKLLGYHSNHCYKAKIPLNRIEEVGNLSLVRWIGYAPSDLKIHPTLKKMISSGSDGEVDVYISVFDSDLNGLFRNKLEEMGVHTCLYNDRITTFAACATPATINKIVDLDFVQFIAPELMAEPLHDKSTPDVGADYIRPPCSSYDGTDIWVGIIDSGVNTAHLDINPPDTAGKSWVGGSPFDDPQNHGTPVAGTIMGDGNAGGAYKGIAEDAKLQSCRVTYYNGFEWIIGDKDGNGWNDLLDAMDWLALHSADIVHCSAGHTFDCGGGLSNGTDMWSIIADDNVYNCGQIYVCAAGNDGDTCGDHSIVAPGCAKNVITVGAVKDYGYTTVDDIISESSRGPTDDGRIKPDLVAPGEVITSCDAFDDNEYVSGSGTSFSAPHVTGMIATLLEHYPELKGHPDRVKALLMSSALLHGGTLGSNPVNTYGLGKINVYRAHWQAPDWEHGLCYGSLPSEDSWQYFDLDIPSGTDRLVLVLTWVEPPASAGADDAVLNNLNMYLDREPFSGGGDTGDWWSVSSDDNVEYIIVENPAADTYRVKIYAYDITTGGSQDYAVGYSIIKGDPTPTINTDTRSNKTYVKPDEVFRVSTDVTASDYIASGVAAKLMDNLPAGITIESMRITREDGQTLIYTGSQEYLTELTLGDIIQAAGARTLEWDLKSSTVGDKTIWVHATSDNAGSANDAVIVHVDDTNPSEPTTSSPTHPDEDEWYDEDDPSFVWETPFDQSGIDGYGHVLDHSESTIPDEIIITTGNSKSYTNLADDIWYFHVRAKDNAGNWGDADHYRAKIDTVDPEGWQNFIPTDWVADQTPDCTIEVKDITAGLDVSTAHYKYSINGGSSWGGWLSASCTGGDGTTLHQTITASAVPFNQDSGTQNKIKFEITDMVGNIGESGEYTVKIDAADPAAPVISSSTHPDENEWYSNNDPSFAWTTPSDTSGIDCYSYILDQSATTTPDTTCEPAGNSKSYTDIADGIWYFHVRAKDNAGNWGGADHYRAKIDTTEISVRIQITHYYGNTSDYNGVPMFNLIESISEGTSPLDLLQSVADVTMHEGRVYSINGIAESPPVYWYLCINGIPAPDEDIDSYPLRDGEVVHWDYSSMINAGEGEGKGASGSYSTMNHPEPSEYSRVIPQGTILLDLLQCAADITMRDGRIYSINGVTESPPYYWHIYINDVQVPDADIDSYQLQGGESIYWACSNVNNAGE